jgi:hypothetical protein
LPPLELTQNLPTSSESRLGHRRFLRASPFQEGRRRPVEILSPDTVRVGGGTVRIGGGTARRTGANRPATEPGSARSHASVVSADMLATWRRRLIEFLDCQTGMLPLLRFRATDDIVSPHEEADETEITPEIPQRPALVGVVDESAAAPCGARPARRGRLIRR